MRHIFTIFVLAMTWCLPAQAQINNTVNRTISVRGEGEIRVVPDQVLISMTAESRGANLQETQKENDQSIKNLMDYASGPLGIEKKHLQTDYTSVEPVYQQCRYDDELSGKCSTLNVVYYAVRKGVQIRLDDPDQYENLITKALELGITHIDNIQFVTTELRKHRDRARELAAKASQEKAAAVAETLGVEVTKPLTINTESYSSFYWAGSSRRGQNQMTQNYIQQAPSSASGGSGDSLALGQINISATVHVVYEIE
jgi:hypothetical protein